MRLKIKGKTKKKACQALVQIGTVLDKVAHDAELDVVTLRTKADIAQHDANYATEPSKVNFFIGRRNHYIALANDATLTLQKLTALRDMFQSLASELSSMLYAD